MQLQRAQFLPLWSAVLCLVLCRGAVVGAVSPPTSEEAGALSGGSSDEQIVYGPKNVIPDDQLFKDPSAFCEGCYGFVTEVSKLLQKWSCEEGSMEEHIETAFLAACTTDRLSTYVLSPPKMVRLCTGILAHYEEETALAILQLYSRYQEPTPEQLHETVCSKAIPACGNTAKPMSMKKKA